MITARSLINETITLIIDNGKQIITAKSDHPRWESIRSAFAAGNDTLLESLVSIKSVIENYSVGKLSVNSAGVTYNGRAIHRLDSQRVMAFLKANMDYKPLANYMANIANNPSKHSIEEGYTFIEHLGLSLTPTGGVIAFKGVNNDYWSRQGNLETVVLQGEVDSAGRIKNSIGATIEVERSSVCDQFSSHCAPGLHAGSLEYAKGWGERVVLVEINPADFVSVPDDANFQKLRCCKYTVIGELEELLPLVYETEHTTKPTNPEKSKFANDSYKKLKRDSKGHFIKMEDCNSNNMKENCNCNTCKGFEELLNDLAPKRISGNLDDEDECNCEDCCENPDCEGHKSFTTFELGYNDGRHDMLHGHNPTYISSDINIIGDSDYIEGYIDGFNSLPI
jgi:hypothetical protein